jgi:hypothetical protein
MRFTIDHQSLSDFFCRNHSDVLNDPRYGGGDTTRMSADGFDHFARMYGLSPDGFVAGGFNFEVLDADCLHRSGLAKYGKITA